MIKGFLKVAAFALVIGLSGCQVNPAAMVPPVSTPTAAAAREFRNSLVVIPSNGPQMSKSEWALSKTLQDAGWLAADTSGADYTVTATVTHEPPISGFTENTGSVRIRYIVTRRYDKAIVFDEAIYTTATKTSKEIFAGDARRVAVIEEYARNNISEFIAKFQRIAGGLESSRIESLATRLSQFDIFSRVAFQEQYLPTNFKNYSLSDVLTHPRSAVLQRIESASSQQIEQFLTNYRSYLQPPLDAQVLRQLEKARNDERRATGTPTKTAPARADVRKAAPQSSPIEKPERKETSSNPF